MDGFNEEAIFKTWVKQSLHEQFDQVVKEPVPETLICILDRRERDNEIEFGMIEE